MRSVNGVGGPVDLGTCTRAAPQHPKRTRAVANSKRRADDKIDPVNPAHFENAAKRPPGEAPRLLVHPNVQADAGRRTQPRAFDTMADYRKWCDENQAQVAGVLAETRGQGHRIAGCSFGAPSAPPDGAPTHLHQRDRDRLAGARKRCPKKSGTTAPSRQPFARAARPNL